MTMPEGEADAAKRRQYHDAGCGNRPPGLSVATVAKLLSDREISAVPVCDEQGKLLGMLSEGDLMRPFGRKTR